MAVSKFKEVKGGITFPRGFVAAGVTAGIKVSKKPDLGLVASALPCTAAGAFTTNTVRASCVDWNAAILPSSHIRAIIVNSGNANACTGTRGEEDTKTMATLAAQFTGCDEREVCVASTGVIGHYMPMPKVKKAIPDLCRQLSAKRGTDFAQAIMTTDLVKKECSFECLISGKPVRFGAAAKGSGMIAPNMATMLGFVTTDAAITAKALNTIVKRVVNRTFNNLTVDGDTSTNDMVVVLANGVSGITVRTAAELKQFEEALHHICSCMCKKIASDGEGATKCIKVTITGAKTEAEAQKTVKAIANSSLVKTAMFGRDPNWGRILAAIGYSGSAFSKTKIEVCISGLTVFKAMRPVEFNSVKMVKALKEHEVDIWANMGVGKAEAISHTCDLTYDYIKINADYHT